VLIPFVQRNFPIGTIQTWYGSIASIPGTWRLCDGSLKTPDLRNRFIGCAGDTYPVGAIGGNIEHNHGFTSDAHDHALGWPFGIIAGITHLNRTGNAQESGITDNKNGLPPYHSLAYIMYAGRLH